MGLRAYNTSLPRCFHGEGGENKHTRARIIQRWRVETGRGRGFPVGSDVPLSPSRWGEYGADYASFFFHKV